MFAQQLTWNFNFIHSPLRDALLGNCGESVPFVVSVLWVPSALCGAQPVITGHSVASPFPFDLFARLVYFVVFVFSLLLFHQNPVDKPSAFFYSFWLFSCHESQGRFPGRSEIFRSVEFG
jgi:hypothetical protein